MSQYGFARCRLSSVVVCNAAGVGGRAVARRHCTAGQYGYIR